MTTGAYFVLTGNVHRILEKRRADAGLSDSDPEPDMSDVLDGFAQKARDHSRVPMQWDASAHAGFTQGTAAPWMRVNEDYVEWNAERQVSDPASVRAFWKRALEIRKAFDVLVSGTVDIGYPRAIRSRLTFRHGHTDIRGIQGYIGLSLYRIRYLSHSRCYG